MHLKYSSKVETVDLFGLLIGILLKLVMKLDGNTLLTDCIQGILGHRDLGCIYDAEVGYQCYMMCMFQIQLQSLCFLVDESQTIGDLISDLDLH